MANGEDTDMHGRYNPRMVAAVGRAFLLISALSIGCGSLSASGWAGCGQGQRWAVFDVIVDGVSLALSHRAQFDRILQRASAATLLQMLKSKVEEDSS
jgi:hypothetical protein